MASITIANHDEVAGEFTLRYYENTAKARVYVRDNDFSVVVIDPNETRFTFEYILYDDKMILRRRVNGLYDANKFPDIVIWQK